MATCINFYQPKRRPQRADKGLNSEDGQSFSFPQVLSVGRIPMWRETHRKPLPSCQEWGMAFLLKMTLVLQNLPVRFYCWKEGVPVNNHRWGGGGLRQTQRQSLLPLFRKASSGKLAGSGKPGSKRGHRLRHPSVASSLQGGGLVRAFGSISFKPAAFLAGAIDK